MKKRTWLWQAVGITDTRQVIDYLKFCRQNQVDVIYLFLSNAVGNTAYREFIRRATGLGIEVHASIGERSAYDPTYYTLIKTRLQRLQEYQETSAPEEMFTGVHFDIEPYTLPEWQNDRSGVLHKWQQVISQYVRDVRSFSGMEISAAVPIALANEDSESRTMREYMVYMHDHLVVMSYRNTPFGHDSISYFVEPYLEAAQTIQRAGSIFAGVETKPVGPDVPSKATYAARSRTEMNLDLSELEFYYSSAATGNNCFGGVAIHALNYWMALEP